MLEEMWEIVGRSFSCILELPRHSVILEGRKEVIQVIYIIFGEGIDCSFSTIYLGNLAAHLMKKDKYLLKILLAASKKSVTRKWLQLEPPTKTEWLDIVTSVQNMERMMFALNLRMVVFMIL